MQKFAAVAAILVSAAGTFSAPSAVVPRKSPPLTITQPSGAETQLSNFKGKVVVMEFLFVRSSHCLRLVELLNKLNSELGPHGFQPIAVAFGPDSDAAVLTHLVDHFKLTYPVGYTSSDKVDSYLGREGNEVLKIPQMVVIDRRGVIRATSGTKGNPSLEDEASLHSLVETLLKEDGRPPSRNASK